MDNEFLNGYLTGQNDKNSGGGGMFGGDGSWIFAFLIIAMIFGGGNWGIGGSRGGGGAGGGVADNYVLATDFATIERKLDGVNSGLCDGFYAVAQGTAGIQQSIANGVYTLGNGQTVQGYETRSAIAGIGSQLQQCCCDNRAAIADLKYTIAQGDCAMGAAVTNAARDIIENQNNNYRALHDEIVANRMEDKNAQIMALNQQLFQQQLAASQAAQNQYLVGQLRPCPVPAYITCNPWANPAPQMGYGTCCAA